MFSAELYHDIPLDYKFLISKGPNWAATNERFAHTKVLSFNDPFQPVNQVGGHLPIRTLSARDGNFVRSIATDILRHSPTLHTITYVCLLPVKHC